MAKAATWYAVRTLPGWQRPKREYWTECEDENGKPVGCRKGYRIVSGLSSAHSAVELALSDAGFIHYMPAEFASVRNRKGNGYMLRRFPLLKGYAFVEMRETDWLRLESVPGIRGVVGNNGVPFSIGGLDLYRLRMYEAKSRAEAQAKVDSLNKSGERLERERRKLISRKARHKLHAGREVKLIWGEKVGREATVEAWEDNQNVRVILKSLEATDEIITVPYEFLKIAG